MANETIRFVLITALFGMGVVALFLTLLSLVMHLIRSTDEVLVRGAASGAAGGGGVGGGETRGRAGLGAGGVARPGEAGSGAPEGGGGAAALPLWAIAAAAVYLDAEDESARHSAAPWTARSNR